MQANITRRRFLGGGLAVAGLGLASGCGLRLPGLAPQHVARIGFLDMAPAGINAAYQQDFVGGLRDLGWVDGENVSFQYQFGDGTYERLDALAAELVELKVDMIVSFQGTGALAATKATSTIPIVFGGIGDPIGTGVIKSFAHPGGNASGTSSLVEGVTQKHFELLKDCVPTISRVAALRNPTVGAPQWLDAQRAAARLDLEFHPLEARDAAEIEERFASLDDHPVDGLVVLSGGTLFGERTRIVGLAAQHRLPAVYPFVEYAEAGGLLAYAANLPDLYRRAASYADKILKGAKPADLPVEQPTIIDFVVNLKAAQALGITIPQSTLSQATRIIQ
jgi:putative ABC transport system substrate-binding protein